MGGRNEIGPTINPEPMVEVGVVMLAGTGTEAIPLVTIEAEALVVPMVILTIFNCRCHRCKSVKKCSINVIFCIKKYIFIRVVI